MEKETDTNFGWWADKPQRADRNGPESRWNPSAVRRAESTVWRNSVLIVSLFVVLGWSLVRLAS
jgi:hypothetical protein